MGSPPVRPVLGIPVLGSRTWGCSGSSSVQQLRVQLLPCAWAWKAQFLPCRSLLSGHGSREIGPSVTSVQPQPR